MFLCPKSLIIIWILYEISPLKGVAATPSKHESFFYIEPTTGINTEAKGRIQLNGLVQKLISFPQVISLDSLGQFRLFLARFLVRSWTLTIVVGN